MTIPSRSLLVLLLAALVHAPLRAQEATSAPAPAPPLPIQAAEIPQRADEAFVRLREMISTNKELSRRLDELEKKVSTHDKAIAGLFSAIRELAAPAPPKPSRRIGFVTDD